MPTIEVECFGNPKDSAKYAAEKVKEVLSRPSERISPGQWDIVARWMDTVYVRPDWPGNRAAVSDYF
jgi:hypothetical protein